MPHPTSGSAGAICIIANPAATTITRAAATGIAATTSSGTIVAADATNATNATTGTVPATEVDDHPVGSVASSSAPIDMLFFVSHGDNSIIYQWSRHSATSHRAVRRTSARKLTTDPNCHTQRMVHFLYSYKKYYS